MILLINICKEKLHCYEFIKPVEDTLKKEGIRYFIKNYRKINKKDLKKADKAIICGTSLKDNDFINDVHRFKWILDFNKPVLGICGGMQVIGLVFGGRLKKKTEIGFFKEKFKKEFLWLKGEQEVYHLHNNYVDFSKLKDFEIFSQRIINQAVKHRKRRIYGVLFHPEVRQKGLIVNFCLI